MVIASFLLYKTLLIRHLIAMLVGSMLL